MLEHKPIVGKKLAAEIRTAINFIERSWRNELVGQRQGYTTRGDRARAASAKHEEKGRALLTAALAKLEPALVYDEETAIAEENALIAACAEAAGNMDAAKLADAAATIRGKRKRRA